MIPSRQCYCFVVVAVLSCLVQKEWLLTSSFKGRVRSMVDCRRLACRSSTFEKKTRHVSAIQKSGDRRASVRGLE